MVNLNGAALMLLQDAAASSQDVHLTMIFIGVIAVCVLLVFLALVVSGVVMARLIKKVEATIDNVEKRAYPLADKAHVLLDQLTPKIHHIAENVEQISYTVRAKADEIGETVSQINKTVQETNGKTQAQVARVDGIVTSALNATHEISQNIQHSIRVPVRQVAGIVSGLKAGLDTLAERMPFLRGSFMKAETPVEPVEPVISPSTPRTPYDY